MLRSLVGSEMCIRDRQGDHTVLPATHTQTIPAFTPQPQGITALWPVPTVTVTCSYMTDFYLFLNHCFKQLPYIYQWYSVSDQTRISWQKNRRTDTLKTGLLQSVLLNYNADCHRITDRKKTTTAFAVLYKCRLFRTPDDSLEVFCLTSVLFFDNQTL